MFDVTVNPEFEAPSSNISGNFLLAVQRKPIYFYAQHLHGAVQSSSRLRLLTVRGTSLPSFNRNSHVFATPVETPLNCVIKR